MSRFSDYFSNTHIRTDTSVPTYLIPSLVLSFCSISLRHYYHFSISLCCLSNRTYHITHIILEIVLYFRVNLYEYERKCERVRISCLNDHVYTSHTHIDFTQQDKKIALRCIEPSISSILAIVGTAHPNTESNIHIATHTHTHTHPQMQSMYRRYSCDRKYQFIKGNSRFFSLIFFYLSVPYAEFATFFLLFVKFSISIFAC